MTLIGGAGSFVGPLLGSVIYTLLQAVVTMFTTYWPLTIGTIILLIVLFVPGGVLGLIEKRIKSRRDQAAHGIKQAASRKRPPPASADHLRRGDRAAGEEGRRV